MSNFEQTIIQGNLGDTPLMRYTGDGTPVCNFPVAVNQGKDAQGNERPAKWYKVSVWRASAESCNKYLVKGSAVLVIGTVKASAYTPKDGGEPRASLELNAREVKFLGGKDDSQQAPGNNAPVQDEGDMPF